MNIRVTTATRTSERARDVPSRMEVVTADQIERRGYRSLGEVLRDLPDFKVERGADPDLPIDIVVQGTRGGGHIVVLLDGVRVSSPTGEPLPILASYPVHSAKQIEVVYGPGSALYGADAFSAVVNIISKDPDDAAGLTLASSVGQFGLTNSAGTYGVRLGRGVKLLVSGQFLSDAQPDLPRYYPSDFGGMVGQRTGTFDTIFGPMHPSTPTSPVYANRLAAHSVHAALRAGHLYVTLFQSAARTPTSPAYTPDNAVYSNETFNRNTLLVVAGIYTRRFGRFTSTSMLTSSRQQLDSESGYRNVFSNMERSYKYAYGSVLKAEQQLTWKASDKWTMTVGGESQRLFSIPQGADLNEPVKSQNEPGTILGTGITDEFFKLSHANFGAYGQAQYVISQALALTVGARADHNTRYGGTINPRVGFVWQTPVGSIMKLTYGSAFLAASPYHQYAHFGGFYSVDGGATYGSSFWHLPNPDLKPQKKSTAEVVVRQGVGSSLEFWGSMFHSRFSSLIRQGTDSEDRYAGEYLGWPVDYIEMSVNQGRAVMFGGSVGLDLVRQFDSDRQVAARVALSIAEGRSDDLGTGDDLQIGGMAPAQLYGNVDLKWERWSVSPRVLVVGQQRVLATFVGDDGAVRRRTLDGYVTLDVHIQREAVFKGVAVFATIENALDRRYRHINLRAYTNPEELIGAPQNPRRVAVGVKVRIP